MATGQQQHASLSDGEYKITCNGHKFGMKLITRTHDEVRASGQVSSRILMVISSSKWYRKTGYRWSGFAFYHPPGTLIVWRKFRGNKKRQRDWDALAEAFKEQVIVPFTSQELADEKSQTSVQSE